MNLPSPPDLDKVADILADLSPKPPDDLVEEVKGYLHRHHVLLTTTRRATPSELRKEMKKNVALSQTPGGQLLDIAGADCSAAALRMLSFAQVSGEPLRATAERCLQLLAKHPNTEVVFKLLRLIWPHVSEEGFRKRWFYKDDIVE